MPAPFLRQPVALHILAVDRHSTRPSAHLAAVTLPLRFLLFFSYYPDVPLSSQILACSAGTLRRDLNARAALYAQRHGLLHELSSGRSSSVLFGEDAHGRHGNFHPASYRAIQGNPTWAARLLKAHTAGRRAQPRADWHWRELDCAGSSDALLMNIFCHPDIFEGSAAALLGISRLGMPRFGVHPRLARERGLIDTTEIDMDLDGLFVEAKLTESNFQSASPALLDRFSGWRSHFDPDALPRTPTGAYAGYQLIRGALAAENTGNRFCVFLDARRFDLTQAWQAVLCAVRSSALRCRLVLLTWQELSASLPHRLQQFLAEKYGISPS